MKGNAAFCPNCGKELAQEANFCQSCGHRVESSELVCFYCGKSIDEDNQVHTTIRVKVRDQNQLNDMIGWKGSRFSWTQAPEARQKLGKERDTARPEQSRPKPVAIDRYFHPICWGKWETRGSLLDTAQFLISGKGREQGRYTVRELEEQEGKD